MTKDNFDIIIIGSGVSGLILAHEIIERTNKSVLMLEKEKKIVMNKNLCFWNANFKKYKLLVAGIE